MEKTKTNLISWDYILQMQDENGNIFITEEVKDNISQLLKAENTQK